MKGKEYLLFTKRERTGIVALIILLLVFVFGQKFFCQPPKPIAQIVSPKQLEKLTAHDESRWVYDTVRHYSYKKKATNFNTFKKKGDSYKPYQSHYSSYSNKHSPPRIIDINLADTTAFIDLPGIGSKLASRIIAFREKLGGFYSVNQIAEVYGLKDSVYLRVLPYLKCNTAAIKKLHINMAGKDELKKHPYIRWQIADALISYRQEHGNFDSLRDLAKVNLIDSVVLTKMIPYLSFN